MTPAETELWAPQAAPPVAPPADGSGGAGDVGGEDQEGGVPAGADEAGEVYDKVRRNATGGGGGGGAGRRQGFCGASYLGWVPSCGSFCGPSTCDNAEQTKCPVDGIDAVCLYHDDVTPDFASYMNCRGQHAALTAWSNMYDMSLRMSRHAGFRPRLTQRCIGVMDYINVFNVPACACDRRCTTIRVPHTTTTWERVCSWGVCTKYPKVSTSWSEETRCVIVPATNARGGGSCPLLPSSYEYAVLTYLYRLQDCNAVPRVCSTSSRGVTTCKRACVPIGNLWVDVKASYDQERIVAASSRTSCYRY